MGRVAGKEGLSQTVLGTSLVYSIDGMPVYKRVCTGTRDTLEILMSLEAHGSFTLPKNVLRTKGKMIDSGR